MCLFLFLKFFFCYFILDAAGSSLDTLAGFLCEFLRPVDGVLIKHSAARDVAERNGLGT